MDEKPKYLFSDRDDKYGGQFRSRAQALGIKAVIAAYCSPLQNSHSERVIRCIRQGCLVHIVVLSPGRLKRVLTRYLDYYDGVRTHLSLYKESPNWRATQFADNGRIVEIKKVGELRLQYMRIAP